MVSLADINEAAVPHKARKRVGRGVGSGHGKTSTRGHNGDGSRAGSKSRRGYEGGQMPLFRRVAKRGFENAAFKTHYHVINLDQLIANFAEGGEITLEALRDTFSLRRDAKVKLLGRGSLGTSISIQVHAASRAACDAVVASGGSVVLV
jgi:large subunit ribosomal protein L15